MKRLTLNRSEWAVVGVTCLYVAGFFVIFAASGNYEFITYVVTVLVLMGLVAWISTNVRLRPAMLWGLSLWGLAHMAGGGISLDGGVLYALQLVPVASHGELAVLRYDQVVHAYGFGVTAWVLWHLLHELFPFLRGTRTIYIFAALASMGLGAVNEVIEFAAVLAFPDNNVGGYFNTALDLVFNATGAVGAVLAIYLAGPAARTAAQARGRSGRH